MRGPMPHGALLVVLAAAFGANGQQVTSPYVSQDDYRAADQAKIAKLEYCGTGFRGTVDRAEGRRSIEGFLGGENIILKVLQGSRSQAELPTVAQNTFTPNWLIGRSWPLVLAVLTIIVYFFCCWSAWPFRKCCQCCRCCVKERQTHIAIKIVGLVLVLGLLIGIIIANALAVRGFNTARDGFKNMACTGGSLLDSMLSGQPDVNFIGMLPLLNTFATLDRQLDAGSPFLTSVSTIVGNTGTIEKAVTVAFETMNLLSSMMTISANVLPKDGSGNTLKHNCTICNALATQVLMPATSALSGGVAKALSDARSEVDKQLAGTNRGQVQSVLRTSTEPLKQVKDLIRATFSFLLDTGGFKRVANLMEGDTSPVLGGTLAIVICAYLLLLCAFTSCGCFICCERTKDPTTGEPGPYRKSPHRCAACTWCWGFLYVLLAFIFGGLLMVVAVPLSSMCLVMDDMSGNLLRSVSPALGVSLTGDSGDMIVTILDRCFSKERTGSTNLLDMLYISNGTGAKITAKQQLVVQVQDQIVSRFDELSQRLVLPDVSANADVQRLRRILGNTDFDAVYMFDAPTYGTEYQNMATDSALIGKAFNATGRCADFTLSADLPAPVGGKMVQGINGFATELSRFGTTPATCGGTVTCRPALNLQELAACNAANNFMALKASLRSANTFRCDVFENPANPALTCDPAGMSKNVNGVWVGDCVKADGKMVPKAVQCDITGFVAYIKSYDLRLQKIFQRLDDDTNAVKTQIDTGLRSLTNTTILQPLDAVAEGLSCDFLSIYYRQTIDGLCFQGVWGFRAVGVAYVVCAILICVLMVLAYALWRRSVDNVNSTGPAVVVAPDEGGRQAWSP